MGNISITLKSSTTFGSIFFLASYVSGDLHFLSNSLNVVSDLFTVTVLQINIFICRLVETFTTILNSIQRLGDNNNLFNCVIDTNLVIYLGEYVETKPLNINVKIIYNSLKYTKYNLYYVNAYVGLYIIKTQNQVFTTKMNINSSVTKYLYNCINL